MKLIIEIDYEIDGEATMDQAKRAVRSLIKSSVVTSEELGDFDAYALIVNSVVIKE